VEQTSVDNPPKNITARFALLIYHADEQREYAYTRDVEKAQVKGKTCE
jgi:hypothetical protein